MKDSTAKIINFTSDPDNICTAAAKISTTRGSAFEIYNSIDASSNGLIPKVMGKGHHSVSEHAVFNIAFDNVSVVVEQFIIEFRLASFTVKSRRYVDYSDQGYVEPEFNLKECFNSGDEKFIKELYNDNMKILFETYSYLLEKGIPKEDARFILPYAFRSNFYCTVNARELMKILYAACYGRGSKYPEIKKLGFELKKQLEEIFPAVFENFEETARFEDAIPEHFSEHDINNESYLPSKKVEAINIPDKQMENIVLSEAIAQTGMKTEVIESELSRSKNFYKSVLNSILKDGRARSLETASFTFRINRLTLAGLTHLTRHRMQTLLVPELIKGTRVKDLIVPESISGNEDAYIAYKEAYLKNLKTRKLISGYIEKDDPVYAYLLLAGMRIDVVITMNLRELSHFFRLRTCMRAQWEIREIAYIMLGLVKRINKDIAAGFGPGCYTEGVCPEGSGSCGQHKEVAKTMESLA